MIKNILDPINSLAFSLKVIDSRKEKPSDPWLNKRLAEKRDKLEEMFLAKDSIATIAGYLHLQPDGKICCFLTETSMLFYPMDGDTVLTPFKGSGWLRSHRFFEYEIHDGIVTGPREVESET